MDFQWGLKSAFLRKLGLEKALTNLKFGREINILKKFGHVFRDFWIFGLNRPLGAYKTVLKLHFYGFGPTNLKFGIGKNLGT